MANARLNNYGFAIESGFIKIFYYDGNTGEYLGEREEYVSKGVSISANSTTINPLRSKKGFAVVMNNGNWEYIEDNRGTIIFDKETRSESTIVSLGKIPDNVTLSAPSSLFDEWDGSKWVKNESKEREYYLSIVKAEINSRLQHATSIIETLKDAIELEQSSDEDEDKLKEWKLYRISLLKFEPEDYSNINYPQQPDL